MFKRVIAPVHWGAVHAIVMGALVPLRSEHGRVDAGLLKYLNAIC